MNKRFLCILLTLMMLLTVIPIGTMAAYAASYTVTVVINGEGSVTYTPEQPEPGDTLTVTATADDGWAISKFTFEDSETELSSITYNSSDWTEDSNDFIMPEDNVTITVDFIKADEIPDKDHYTVTIDPNGGEGDSVQYTVAAGETFTLPDCEYTKADAAFVKWDADGSYYDPGCEIEITDDTFVKAIWLSNTSTKIDNSVDRSTTEVVGTIIATDTRTGEVSEQDFYDEFSASAFTNPSNPNVTTMIEEAKAELADLAQGYNEASNINITVSDPAITETNDSRNYTYFDGDTNYLIIDGTYYHSWRYNVTLTMDYTSIPMSFFSVWMSDTDQNANTGGGVVISYLLPDGSEPDDGTIYRDSSTNLNVIQGSQVTLTAEPYAYLGYRFVGWYQANINKLSPDDPHYLTDKLISTDKTYTFVDNPVGVGEAPYICAVFEDTGIIRQGDQIQVWITDGGKAAVEYTPSEPNIYEFEATDGTDFVSVGEVVQYYKGDEITVHQKADEGYVFKGWYHVWIEWGPEAEHPKYEGEVISTDPTFTYKPGETIVDGDTEPLRYVCAVFDKAPESYILGDADGNGSVESIDVTLLQRAIALMDTPYSEQELLRGDADGNGAIEITDVTEIQRYLAGLNISYPIGEPIGK